MALLDVDEETRTKGAALLPEDIRGAEQAGTAEKLAHFILDDLDSPLEHRSRKLLYLTGDKNRDVLPNILAGGEIELHTVQVYETRGSSTFDADLDKVLSTYHAGTSYIDQIQQREYIAHSGDVGDSRWWIVFFAPSSAEYTFPSLRQRFDMIYGDEGPAMSGGRRSVDVATIGPTTTTFLRNSLGLHVAVESPKPTAEVLAGAIAAYDEPECT
jgi:uroporphyrinogen-III synthase